MSSMVYNLLHRKDHRDRSNILKNVETGQAWAQNYSNSIIIHTMFSTQTHVHSSVQNEQKSEEKSEEKAGT